MIQAALVHKMNPDPRPPPRPPGPSCGRLEKGLQRAALLRRRTVGREAAEAAEETPRTDSRVAGPGSALAADIGLAWSIAEGLAAGTGAAGKLPQPV
jgi:hypothetical protein